MIPEDPESRERVTNTLLAYTSLLILGGRGDLSILCDRETRRWWVRFTPHLAVAGGTHLVADDESLHEAIRLVSMKYATGLGLL